MRWNDRYKVLNISEYDFIFKREQDLFRRMLASVPHQNLMVRIFFQERIIFTAIAHKNKLPVGFLQILKAKHFHFNK